MKHPGLAIVLCAGAAAAPASAQPAPSTQAAAAPPLIERTKLFGNPSKTGARLSPDGRWLLYIAPRDGVLNVWVAPAARPDDARPMTAETVRPIRNAEWSPDSKTVLFVNDKGGDENFLLYGVDVASGATRNYTPFEKTRVEIVATSRSIQGRILVGINNRDPRWHDLYRLDLGSGELTLLQRNDGYAGFFADDQLTVRMVSKARPDGGTDYHRVEGESVAAAPLARVDLDDSLTTAPLGFTRDGKTLYWSDSRGRDTAALVAQNAATGARTVVAADARADIGRALFEPRTGRAQAYAVNYLKNEYVAIDPAIRADLDFLKAEARGEFAIISRTDDDARWLVSIDRVTEPASVWVYERAAKTLTPLYVGRPELQGQPLMPMSAQEIETRDGLKLVSYLTLPAASAGAADGRPGRAVPMVLLVHGGPWARDSFGYHPYHQWLANRGYAVLSVNYRGSTGFGKGFIGAGDLQWGRKMHDDLLDAVAWAVRRGVTTADKVAIMGGSYGGYATLAGLAFTPESFACGVDIVGPSNLFTLLQTIPPYWEAAKQQFYKRMGDPTTEAGRALLKERSPLNAADRIARPLLIGQGANDPRVNVAESDQIVDAMKARRIPVTYVVFPDEGHGFARPVNNIAFNTVAENFLARCLGGRSEPIGDTLKASTAEVRHGAEFAPGLADAVGAR